MTDIYFLFIKEITENKQFDTNYYKKIDVSKKQNLEFNQCSSGGFVETGENQNSFNSWSDNKYWDTFMLSASLKAGYLLEPKTRKRGN